MYARTAQLGRMRRVAGAHRLSGLRGLRGSLGQDWGDIINNAISTAGSVASVALKPPTYSSVVNPYTGAQTVTSYGGVPQSSLLSGSPLLGGADLTSVLTSPIVLLGGLGLIAVLLLKR